jgi:hypothetical protein
VPRRIAFTARTTSAAICRMNCVDARTVWRGSVRLCKEMATETAAAAARHRKEHVYHESAEADAAKEAEAPAAEQADLNKKAMTAVAKARAAREKAEDVAKEAVLEQPDLEPLQARAMPRPGLTRNANGTPTAKTQRNFTDPPGGGVQGSTAVSCRSGVTGSACRCHRPGL